jgi:hypothetical protein
MTFCIMTLHIMSFSQYKDINQMTFSMMTLSITTFNLMRVSITTFSQYKDNNGTQHRDTLQKDTQRNDTQQNDIQNKRLSTMTFSITIRKCVTPHNDT